MKRKISLLISTILILSSVFTFSIHANDASTSSLNATCSNGCFSPMVVVCMEEFEYDYSETHRYNLFTKTCTVDYYNATYGGMMCPTCYEVSDFFDGFDGVHLCQEVHRDCGKGHISWCQDGEVF